MIEVDAILCPSCNTLVYSRAQHDFRWCPCKKSFIDGGRTYTRYGGDNFHGIKVVRISVDHTEKEMYDDWNHSCDKLGIIIEGETSD